LARMGADFIHHAPHVSHLVPDRVFAVRSGDGYGKAEHKTQDHERQDTTPGKGQSRQHANQASRKRMRPGKKAAEIAQQSCLPGQGHDGALNVRGRYLPEVRE